MYFASYVVLKEQVENLMQEVDDMQNQEEEEIEEEGPKDSEEDEEEKKKQELFNLMEKYDEM